MQEEIITSNFLDKVSVLYVEDEEYIREGLARLLGRRIQTLFLAGNGKEGFQLFNERNPDIIITDIRMPVMDGLEMARRIKSVKEEIPIIITTAYNDEEYFLKAIDIGIDKYIKKPVNKNELIKVLTTVSRSILQQKEIEAKNKFIRIILDNSPELVFICDSNRITYMNRSFLNFLGCESFDHFMQEYDGLEDFFVPREGYLNPGEQPLCQSLAALGETEVVNGVEPIVHLKGKNQLKSEAKTYLVHVNRIPEHQETMVTFSDITEIERERQLYQELAIKDPLTGIFNRKKFNEEILKEVERAKRYNRKIALVMFDIDHFKNVNDTFGHQVGDSVLQETAELIRNNIRQTDFFSRYGGEEFIIIVPETTCEAATEIAEKLRENIEAHNYEFIERLTCSFGVTELQKNEDLREFLKRVDDALYEAKNQGRNKVVPIPVANPTGQRV